MTKIWKEPLLWVFVVLPFIYLWTIWANLRANIPTHFDFTGEPNGWTRKEDMVYWLAGLGLGIYLLMLAAPYMDPKGRIQQMGNKYYSLRLVFSIFICGICLYTLYTGQRAGTKSQSPAFIFAIVGTLFMVLGNYFQTLRPNYFIGIRTPWTLESEEVWKNTHRMAGKLWMVGGLACCVLCFTLTNKDVLGTAFLIIIGTLALGPILYSYFVYKGMKVTDSK